MKLARPVCDYRQLRLHNLNSSEFSHLKLLLYWPLFAITFFFTERIYKPDSYTEMYCPIDDYIPFEEIFLIPYMFWFVYLVGMHAYTLLYDTESFVKLMKLIILTYTAALIVFLLFPTVQNLRPAQFERDNFLTRFMASFYKFDTNTNVCPSIHVIGSLAAWFTSLHCKAFRSVGWRLAFGITTFLISISTVFLKQHSVIDILAALPICAAAYLIVYGVPKFKRKALSSDR